MQKCPAADPAPSTYDALWSTQPMMRSATRVLYVPTLPVMMPPPSNPWLMVLLCSTRCLVMLARHACAKNTFRDTQEEEEANHPRLLLAAAAKQAPLHSEDRAPPHSLPYLPDHESTSASAVCYRRYSPSFFGVESWLSIHSVHSQPKREASLALSVAVSNCIHACVLWGTRRRLFLCPHRERASPTSVQKTAAPSAERCPELFVGLIRKQLL